MNTRGDRAGMKSLRLRITAAAESIARAGHPWVFAQSVREQNRPGKTGELAVIFDRADHFLAVGLFDETSPIRVRILHAGKPQLIDHSWWQQRAARAFALRQNLFDSQTTTGFRLISGENDGWPGLVLDQYDTTRALKLYTAAWLPRLNEMADLLKGKGRLVLRLSRNIQKQAVENFGLAGEVVEWRSVRNEIHEDICRQGFDAGRNAFTQSYGSKELDASVLMIPLVGFLPATDPRVKSTVELIEKELVSEGLVQRYQTSPTGAVDGLPPGEGAFLPCSFWLADCLHLMGRHEDARGLYERLLAVQNDLGLMSEEYDPVGRRQLGNFPQAFSHVSLVNTAYNLHPQVVGPAEDRGAAPIHA